MHDDGVAGLRILKDHGGATIVQDPAEAPFPYLPLRAIEDNPVDHVCTISEMVPLLLRLAKERSTTMAPPRKKPPKQGLEKEGGEVARNKADFERGGGAATATGLTCPDCGGAIWEFDKESVLQFRCHVGHVYSVDSFVDGQGETVEVAMWTALRALEEKEMLLSRLASRAKDRGATISARHFETAAGAVVQKIELIRRAISSRSPSVGTPEEEQTTAFGSEES